jgi:hypothetical protein
MAFHRSNNDSVAGSRWRIAHHATLVECGIPYEVADSDDRWAYVLLHGDDELGTGWNASWISEDQAARLLAMLEVAIESSIGLDLIPALRLRCRTATK